MNTFFKPVLHLNTALLATPLIFAISACDIETSNNIPDVPPEGRFVAVGVNQHTGVTSAQVGIAIFDDGTPVKLVGGDVVQASSTHDSILLLEDGFYNGSYVASLPNDLNFNQINFLMVHEPLEARQDRWYPVDLLNFDPGPGEFVGASATVTLPPEPLNLALSSTSFNSINDSFTISWSAEAAADIMRIRSAVSCTNGTKITSYGTEVVLADDSDDGTEVVGLDQFIYDIHNDNQTIKFLLGEARIALQELLEKLSGGAIDDSFFANYEIINPIENDCEIRLFLFRQRNATFNSTSTNGRIFGSRSADVTLFYNPN